MKLKYYLLLSALLCSFNISAQRHDLSQMEVPVNTPSYVKEHSTFYATPMVVEGTMKFSYYIDESGQHCLHGPSSTYGKDAWTYSDGSYSNSLSIKNNWSHGKLNGTYSANFNEKVKHKYCDLDVSIILNTSFKDNYMTGSLSLDETFKDFPDTQKKWWHITLDNNKNPKSIDCSYDNVKIKATLDSDRRATGSYTKDGVTYKFIKGILTSHYIDKNGNEVSCTSVQKALLDKYKNGTYTEKKLLESGYLPKYYSTLPVELNTKTLKHVGIQSSLLGDFSGLDFDIQIMHQIDLLSYEDMCKYLDSNSTSDPLEWSKLNFDHDKMQVFLNGSWYYAKESDYEKFEQKVDSYVNEKCTALVEFLLNGINQGELYKHFNLEESKTCQISCEDFANIQKLGKCYYKLENAQKKKEDKHRIVKGTLTFNEKHKDGPVEYALEVEIFDDYRGWYATINYLTRQTTPWDEYRTQKSSIIASCKSIIDEKSKYDRKSYKNLANFYNSKKNAKDSLNESLADLSVLKTAIEDFKYHSTALKNIVSRNKWIIKNSEAYPDMQESYKTFIKDFNYAWDADTITGKSAADYKQRLTYLSDVQKRAHKYLTKRKEFDDNSAKALVQIGEFEDVADSYNKFISAQNIAWTPDFDCNKLEELIKIQNSYVVFCTKRKAILEGHAKISEIGAKEKNIYPIYMEYYASADQKMPADYSADTLDEIKSIQADVIAILSDPQIKKISKSVKKEKLTDIKAIIRFANMLQQDYSPEGVNKETVVKNESRGKDRGIERVSAPKYTGKKNGRGYGQYVDVTALWDFLDDGIGVSANINYIGGYRFNKNFFLGLGTGISINNQDGNYSPYNSYGQYGFGYDISYFPHSFMSIPVYLHFRTDFGKHVKPWYPYISLSAGYHFSIAPIGSAVPGDIWADLERIVNHFPTGTESIYTPNKGFMGEINFGINRRLTEKMGMYFGLGFRVETRKEKCEFEGEIDSYGQIINGTSSSDGSAGVYSTRLSIGLTF